MDSKEKKTTTSESKKEAEVKENAQETATVDKKHQDKEKVDKKSDKQTEQYSAAENATETQNSDAKDENKQPLTKEEELTKQVEGLQSELDDYKDKYLRLAAEFDNYRRRTMKEKTELILNGSEKCINTILPVLDDLERALGTMDKAEDVKAVSEGVKLIYNKFVQILGSIGVKEIETEGKALDTDFHEAIALVPVPDEKQKGKIIDCTQKGYTLNEKVIRHAKVVIGQ